MGKSLKQYYSKKILAALEENTDNNNIYVLTQLPIDGKTRNRIFPIVTPISSAQFIARYLSPQTSFFLLWDKTIDTIFEEKFETIYIGIESERGHGGVAWISANSPHSILWHEIPIFLG